MVLPLGLTPPALSPRPVTKSCGNDTIILFTLGSWFSVGDSGSPLAGCQPPAWFPIHPCSSSMHDTDHGNPITVCFCLKLRSRFMLLLGSTSKSSACPIRAGKAGPTHLSPCRASPPALCPACLRLRLFLGALPRIPHLLALWS